MFCIVEGNFEGCEGEVLDWFLGVFDFYVDIGEVDVFVLYVIGFVSCYILYDLVGCFFFYYGLEIYWFLMWLNFMKFLFIDYDVEIWFEKLSVVVKWYVYV